MSNILFNADKLRPKQIRYRLANETTLNRFYHKFSMIDITHIINESDNNEALIELDNKILECYNECCSIKPKISSSKDQIKPWLNQSIKNIILMRLNSYKLSQLKLISEREYKFFIILSTIKLEKLRIYIMKKLS